MYLGGVLCGDGSTSKSTGRSERVESSLMGDVGPPELQKTKGHEHLCDTAIPVQRGNLGNDQATTTKPASMRKQVGTKNSKTNEDRG